MPQFNDNLNSQYRAELVISQVSQDVVNNRSRVSWLLRVRKLEGSGYWTGSGHAGYAYSVTVNGSSVASDNWTYDFRDYTLKTVDSGEVWVNHNSDGTKTFSSSASITMGGPGGTGTPSGNTTLTTIPRATQPTLSSSSVDAGVSVTINTPRASSSFDHDITFVFGGASGTIATGVAISTSWTPPVTLLNQIPTATSGTCVITCKTYNGTTLIGTKTVNLTIKAATTVVPTFTTVTHAEATSGVATNVGAYVKSISTLLMTITGAAGVYSSTISAYKIEVLSGATVLHTINAASGTSTPINGSGSLTIRATVTDSRGRTAQQTVGITVLNWAPPVLTSVSSQRANSGGTPDPNGTYIRVNINASVSSLMNTTERNALNYRIKTRDKGTTTWTTKGSWTPGGITFNSNRTVGTYSVSTAHEVLLEVYDDFATSGYQMVIATSSIFMHWGNANAGEGVGIGKYWQYGALDVLGDIALSGKLLGPLGEEPIATSHHVRGSSGTVYVRLATVNGVSSSSGSIITGDFYGGSNYGTSERYSARIHFSERNGGGLLEVWEFGKPASASAQVRWRIKTISTYVYELWAVLPSFHETYSFVPTLVTQGTLDKTATSTDPTGLSTTNVVVYSASPYQVPWGFARTDLASWSIPTGATVVALGSADILDTMTFASDAFTIVQAGWYQVDGTFEVTPGTAGLGTSVILGYVQINGASSGTAVSRIWPQSNSATVMYVSGKFLLAVGDTVRLAASRTAAMTGATLGEATLSVLRIK